VIAGVARNRDLRRVALSYAGFISVEVGVWIAMLVYAFDQGGATTAGVVALVQLVPAALFAPYGGVLADRHSPAAVLAMGYIGQAVAMGGTAASLLAGGPPALSYGLAAVAATLVTATRPAQAVLVPELVHEPDELTAFNVLSGWIESASLLVAPAITGVLLGVANPGAVFVVGTGVALAAGLVCSRIAHRLRVAPGTDGSAVGSTLTELAEGIRAAGGTPASRLLVLLIAAQDVVLGAFDVLAVVLAIDTLHMGDAGAGYLNAAFGVGAVVGAAATVMLIGRPRLSPPLIAGAAVTGLSFVLLGAFPTVLGAFVLLAIAGAGRMVFDVSGRTLLQRTARPNMLSRTFALLEALSMGSLAIGSMVVPALVALGGASAALIGVGALLPALALLRFKTLRMIDAEATVPIVEIGLLRSLNVFAPLPAPVLEGLARGLVAERFAAGSVVAREGEPGESFYAIADGEITVSAQGRTLASRGRCEGIGEIALLRDVPRTATLTARTNALLYRLDKESFLAAVTGHAPAAEAADSVVEDRLATLAAASRGPSA
jgi:MFS family permease